MKRHESIAPLSRDHHTALLCCWKLRQGIKKEVSAERMGLYVTYFFKQHLLPHFNEEESIIFSAAPGELTAKAMADHQQLIKWANSIETDASHEMLTEFAKMLDNHIRFEERVLFPHVENFLTEEKLNNIAEQLHKLHNKENKDDYKDNFWV